MKFNKGDIVILNCRYGHFKKGDVFKIAKSNYEKYPRLLEELVAIKSLKSDDEFSCYSWRLDLKTRTNMSNHPLTKIFI